MSSEMSHEIEIRIVCPDGFLSSDEPEYDPEDDVGYVTAKMIDEGRSIREIAAAEADRFPMPLAAAERLVRNRVRRLRRLAKKHGRDTLLSYLVSPKPERPTI